MTLVREFAASRSDAAFAALVERHIALVHSAALRQAGDAHLEMLVGEKVRLFCAAPRVPALERGCPSHSTFQLPATAS